MKSSKTHLLVKERKYIGWKRKEADIRLFIPFIPFVQASKEEKLSICKEIIKKSLTEIHARCMVKKVRFDLETLLCDIFPSKWSLSNGRSRIPDYTNTQLKFIVEVKNVKRLSNTRQLRDFARIASENQYRKILITQTNTVLSNPLKEAGLRTPLSKITSTGEIEQRFRLNWAMVPPGLSSPTAQVEYGQNKSVKVS